MTAPYEFVTKEEVERALNIAMFGPSENTPDEAKLGYVIWKLLAERDAFRQLAMSKMFCPNADPDRYLSPDDQIDEEARKILTSREGKDGAA